MYKIKNLINENKTVIIDSQAITIKPNEVITVKKACDQEAGLLIETIDEKTAKQKEETKMEVNKNGR
jgi:hypothetical protein